MKKNKNLTKKKKITAIGTLTIIFAIASLTYSSYVLYTSSRTTSIKNKAQKIKNFISNNYKVWDELCLLVQNKLELFSAGTSLFLSNSINSYIYISYEYIDNDFKENWNSYINKYRTEYLNMMNNELVYDLKNNEMFDDSIYINFANNLFYLVEDMLFYKINDDYAFALSLSFEILMIIVIIIVFWLFIKNRKLLRGVSK